MRIARTTHRRVLYSGLALGVLLTGTVPVMTHGAGGHENDFVFRPLDVPGSTSTLPQGINDAGDISGVFTDSSGRHGFVLRRGEWMPTVVDYPGAAWTRVFGINAQGDVVGTYGPGDGSASDVVGHGFLRSRHGQFTNIHYPGHLYEITQRITSTGIILGCYHDTDFMGTMHGFIRFPWDGKEHHGNHNGLSEAEEDTGLSGLQRNEHRRHTRGSFTGFELPNSMFTGATADASIIVGIYGGLHSFVLEDGTFTPFDVPGSTLTWAYEINSQGHVVGHYRDSSGMFHGFLRDEDGEFTTLNFPGSNNTQARSLNARGEVTGFYVKDGVNHGFIARPTREWW